MGAVGSHEQFEHAAKPGRVTIPHHGSATLGPKVIRSIIKQAGLSVERLIELL